MLTQSLLLINYPNNKHIGKKYITYHWCLDLGWVGVNSPKKHWTSMLCSFPTRVGTLNRRYFATAYSSFVGFASSCKEKLITTYVPFEPKHSFILSCCTIVYYCIFHFKKSNNNPFNVITRSFVFKNQNQCSLVKY